MKLKNHKGQYLESLSVNAIGIDILLCPKESAPSWGLEEVNSLILLLYSHDYYFYAEDEEK